MFLGCCFLNVFSSSFSLCILLIFFYIYRRKEGHVLVNDALNLHIPNAC